MSRGSESRVEELRGCRLVDGMSPIRINIEVEHGNAPRVHGQGDRQDAQDVHDEAGLHLGRHEERLSSTSCVTVRRRHRDPTMSLTMRCPEAKAMELGGVDTGSMKA